MNRPKRAAAMKASEKNEPPPKKEKKVTDKKSKTTPSSKKVKKTFEKKVEEDAENSSASEEDYKTASSVYDFTVKDIDGNDVPLAKYKGHVLLIVNVASRCGHTKKNYTEMVQLHEKYAKSNGLRILAFPCNQFGSQESGTNEKIKSFAEARNVEFDLFDKVKVNGKDACPLYNFLKYKVDGEVSPKNIVKWNFAKFIVNKEGIPVERFVSSKSPMSLEENLKKLF